MPKLSHAEAKTAQRVEFVLSAPLDMLNAMNFTSLVEQAEGIDAWPAQVRREMAAELRAELDFLYNFPIGQCGIMAWLGDLLFVHREAWPDLESLLRLVRQLPAGVGEPPDNLGIQGLVLAAAAHAGDRDLEALLAGDPRQELTNALSTSDADVDAVLDLYDRPEELRLRMLRLIERFYHEHYREEQPRRWPCLERSVNAHRAEPSGDVVELTRRLAGRSTACLEDVCPGPYDELLFAPSLDMGPYISCMDAGRVHALFYPCEPQFVGAAPEAVEEARLARLFKALSDEQRLKILHMLKEREMYVQEIVERAGLHQSVVSRHLMFMRAVGLVLSRRQNNMKFFSLNPQVREQLARTMELFEPGPPA